MGLRFSRRVPLIPGLRVNLSKSGALSIGHRGLWYTIGPRGRRTSLGLSGTGLYWTERVPPAAPPHAGHSAAFIIVVLIGLAAVLWMIGGGGR
jgi:hypothetical protein